MIRVRMLFSANGPLAAAAVAALTAAPAQGSRLSIEDVLSKLMWLMLMGSVGCNNDVPERPDWPGEVDAEVDDLTGIRTGLYRTFGPMRHLSAGADTIPITLGYWCEVDESSDPASIRDGLFFLVAMPDTSLLESDEQAFEELSGQLGLLDVARLAVDGRVYAWEYDPEPTYGGWYLYGNLGHALTDDFSTTIDRAMILGQLEEMYESAGNVVPSFQEQAEALILSAETNARDAWPVHQDYVTSHYVGRNTLGIELKGVVEFPMAGLAAAADSVRFWCPLSESILEWNTIRQGFFEDVEILREGAEIRMAAMREAERERQAAEAARQAELARENEFVQSLIGSAVGASIFLDFAARHDLRPVLSRGTALTVCEAYADNRSSYTPAISGFMNRTCRRLQGN